MSVQIVLDSSGDSRHEFDASDAVAVALAEQRFRQLTARGYQAVAFTAPGEAGDLVKAFDPKVQKTIFIPRLVGG